MMEAVEAVMRETVETEDLKHFEQIFETQLRRGGIPSDKAQFDYSWCLIRSRYSNDLRRGISLLEELFHRTQDETAKRDYLYYLTIGNAKLKEYQKAKKYVDAILLVEPNNHQASCLKRYIEKKMRNEGLLGIALVGGAAAAAIGGLVGIGLAISKK
ncbi:mitochondrial fission 1 protein-like [Tubulanus polymorphus]|uniref:mitochondrial fission 1 protein-like n=1 Tax=Tubulanus polymorphus TaxID=672921 RepID=UPI003DA62910